MNITVYGAGYVGLVSAVCLAELGHYVCCVDIDQNRIDSLNQGQVPIYEDGLIELLKSNLEADRIHFTTDLKTAVLFGKVQIIAVGTPSAADGSVDMAHVYSVARHIGSFIKESRVVVTKSTVPVGSADKINNIIKNELKKRHLAIKFDVVSNPEFLKEGAAISDFMNPDRIIIGSQSTNAIEIMRELYAPLIKKGKPFLIMSERSAEFTKYVANAFLATKISFMNEMSRVTEKIDVDIENVKKAIGFDKRISEKFLNPGCGFGGSCFPKDISALRNFAKSLGTETYIIKAVLETNAMQKRLLFDKINTYFDGKLQNKVIALWGLSFKPNTDDVRCAPSRTLIELLCQAGAIVRAYDPLAMKNIAALYDQCKQLQLCENMEATLENADALAIVTEWDQFKNPDFELLKKAVKNPVIFDGRNLYDLKEIEEKGFQYYSVGRTQSAKKSSDSFCSVSA